MTGGRFSHKHIPDRLDYLEEVRKVNCRLCRKFPVDGFNRLQYWPQCIDPLCASPYAPNLKSQDMNAYHEWENSHDCWLDRQTPPDREKYHFCPIPEDILIDTKIQKGTLVDKHAIAHKEAILKAAEADKAAAEQHSQLIKEHKARRAKQRQALTASKPYAKKSSNVLLQTSRYAHRKQQKLGNQKSSILTPQQEVTYNAVFNTSDPPTTAPKTPEHQSPESQPPPQASEEQMDDTK